MDNYALKTFIELSQAYHELEDLFMGFVRAMVNALEAKSPWTRGHSERVTAFSQEIACEMKLDDDLRKEVTIAALLHDIGKIGTSGNILEKGGRLSTDEYEIMKMHPVKGADILKGIPQFGRISMIVRHHHERMDGNGYPDGLKSDMIPIGSRIIHVADAFDAMTEARPYRTPIGLEEAARDLRKNVGDQFDPSVVDAWIRVLEIQKDRMLESKKITSEG